MIDYKGREVLCSVRNMEVTFGKGRKAFVAVKGVNFDIYKGETFGLVGESGSGKTTIGRAIIRINPISAGEVLFKGERISGKISKEMDKMVTQKIQMIFQDPMASLNERAKVDYIVSEGLMNVHPDMKKEEREERVSQALSDVGLLPEFATRFPHEFSGGQRQRIGIARALIMEPEFIIADEPISALDVSIRAQVLNLMSKLQKERGLTYLFIAHDLSVMRFITDRIAVMSWRRRRSCMRIRCTPTPRRCFRPSRCPIRTTRRRKSSRCTIRRCIIMRTIRPGGSRSKKAISSWPTVKKKRSTARS